MIQDNLMRYCPATGVSNPPPYPSDAKQWRAFHGQKAWLFNPWSGDRRRAEDVGSDTFGHLINPVPGSDLRFVRDKMPCEMKP